MFTSGPAGFVDDPDEAMRLDCDGVDETDPAAVARYAAEHGLTVAYVPDGAVPRRLAGAEWLHWRERLVAYAEGEPLRPAGGRTACPG